MNLSGPPEPDRCEVLAVGPLPPPFTGMALLTKKIIGRLQQMGSVTMLNVSPGESRSRLVFRFQRFLNTIGCLGRLIVRGRAGNRRLYVVANSQGAGLLTTFALVNAGRLLGYSVYLHHHTYFYIDRYDWRMNWINRTLGSHGVHVVHCPQMADDFRARYDSSHPFECVLPSVFALPVTSPRRAARAPIQLGHMGNLSVAKGLDVVLDTFRALCRTGRRAQLRLAGPFHTREAQHLVTQAREEFAEDVVYVGPVYDTKKEEYFKSIDCFLFPSRSESWGIVLNEAMAAGVPVIASRRGCNRVLVGDRAGMVIDDATRFVPLAVAQIQAWIDDATQYYEASAAAVEQAAALDREGQLQLAAFAEHMVSPLASSAAGALCRSHQPC